MEGWRQRYGCIEVRRHEGMEVGGMEVWRYGDMEV